jgi:predicted DNA-binding transcriptional regulator YafY
MEFLVIVGLVWFVYSLLNSNDTSKPENPNRGSSYGQRPQSTGGYSAGKSEESREDAIRRAIASGRQLTFRYVDQQGEITNRTVSPRYLETRHEKDILMLKAYCHLRNEDRSFVVRRMSDVYVV